MLDDDRTLGRSSRVTRRVRARRRMSRDSEIDRHQQLTQVMLDACER
jgi:hypothetical protein